MSLCAPSSWPTLPEFTTTSAATLNTRVAKVDSALRRKFFHGDFVVGLSCTCPSRCYRKEAVIHVRAFLRDGLERGRISLDKEVSVIKETSGWSSIHQGSPEVVAVEEDLVVTVSETEEEDSENVSLVKLPAARPLVQLLSAWDSLSERLAPESVNWNGSQLLLAALKIAVPAFQLAPFSEDGRFQLSRALDVAYTLADLHMDAEVIAAGILRVAVDTKLVSIGDVQRELGVGTVGLLHDCLRVHKIARRLDDMDEESANILREFSLTFHDMRAVVVELAVRLDGMRHISSLPKHQQQILALENMQIYAPLAHALGLGNLSQELEDMAFRLLFPDSYRYVENWLQNHWGNGEVIISDSIKQLKEALEGDAELQGMVETVQITGRFKSRFSTMKKLLKDGRRPDQVYDILGLRVILFPKAGAGEEVGIKACYRAQTVVTRIWKEVPGRMKDYIARPKQNGYSSLHLAIYLTQYGPWSLPLELQIRTSAMHAHAVGGGASHALYKVGLTDPKQVEHFKAVMLAAAKAAAYRFRDVAAAAEPHADHIFQMFDKNMDGVISRQEFQDVFLELGADQADVYKIMQLVDTNTDGSVDAQELEELRRQIRNSRKVTEDSSFSMREDLRNQEQTLQLPVF